MIWETIFFYLFAFGALVSSLAVVVFRNPLYSAIALILDFFFFAGLYVLLSAHFMAVIQVLVYGGAIMVLFVFIIMLLNLREEELGGMTFRVQHVLGVLVGIGIFAFSAAAITPLMDRGQVIEDRARAEQRAEQRATELGEDAEVKVVMQTPARVPGLFADLNEEALELHYQRQLAAMRAGSARPSDRKYREFDPSQPLELPPVLQNQNPRGGPLDKPVTFGTVEPISLLLVNRFVVPFELTALLLLAAIVGAVIIAKKRL